MRRYPRAEYGYSMNLWRWTHESVRQLAGNDDPVAAVTAAARSMVTKAVDDGWQGPPFDPFELADLLGIQLKTNTGLRDARLLLVGETPCIEFNPERPRGRLRYSIAHEIAHTIFPDWHLTVRNRTHHSDLTGGETELETLCNIAAAELLMPIGSAHELHEADISIELLNRLQRDFDVSTEALFIRAVKVSEQPCAMMVARASSENDWAVEYAIPSANWDLQLGRGDRIPEGSVVTQLRGIGHTKKSSEVWPAIEQQLRVEVIGIPGVPGSPLPRVVAWLRPLDSEDVAREWLTYIWGDATHPSTPGPKVITQVVSDAALTWGGGGFAAAVRRTYPPVQEAFRGWVMSKQGALTLGRVHCVRAAEDVFIASIVAQHGFGPSKTPRIRYHALAEGLDVVARLARDEKATIHMPRIGAGQAGGSWELIEDLLATAFRDTGLSVTVYDVPPTTPTKRTRT